MKIESFNILSLAVQQLLQVAVASQSAIELLQRLQSFGDLSILPITGHALHQAIELLLHQQTSPAIPAVAMT